MATIVTRSGKGSPLTNTEVDSNFTNLNTDKLETSGGTITGDLNVDGDATLGNATTDEHTINGSLQILSTTNEANLLIKTTFSSETPNTPDVKLYNNSAQSGDDNDLGIIQFFSNTTNYSNVQFADIVGMAFSTGATDLEGGVKFRFSNGSQASWQANRHMSFRPSKIQYFTGATDKTTTLQFTDPTADRTITLPDATGTISLTSATETLTNKTLTSPVISGASFNGAVTFPQAQGIKMGVTNSIPNGVFLLESHGNGNTSLHQSANDLGITVSGTDTNFIVYGDDGTTSVAPVKYIENSGSTGEVRLFHYGTQKLSTKSTGVEIDGGVLDIKNDGSQSELRLYCESNNAHYASLKAPAHADFSGDITLTLPASTGTLLSTANSDAPTTTTSSGDADFVLVDDGGVMKKITPANLGIGGSGTLTVQDEGSALSTEATTLNFVGAGVTASGTGAVKTITISGGGSGSGGGTTAETWGASLDGKLQIYNSSAGDQNLLIASPNTTSASEPLSNYTGSGGTIIGNRAGEDLTSGSNNTLIGYFAGGNINTGGHNTYVGFQAGGGTDTESRNVAIGSYAFDSGGMDYSVGVGYLAGRYNGDRSTSVGYYAGYGLYYWTGQNYSTSIGYNAGANNYNNNAYNNVNVGYYAGNQIRTGDYNTFLGGYANTQSSSTSLCVSIGYGAKANTSSVSIGYGSQDSGNSDSTNTVTIGYNAGFDMDGGDYSIYVGYRAGFGGGTGSYNIAVGSDALYNIGAGASNIAIGHEALNDVTSGSNNTAIGYQAGATDTTGEYNVFMGYQAGFDPDGNVTTSNYNVGIGALALEDLTNGSGNVGIGRNALAHITTGSSNTAIGYLAGDANTTSGDYNVFIGYAAKNSSGGSSDNGVAIGRAAQAYNGGVSIGYEAMGGSNNSSIYNVAIGYEAHFDAEGSDYSVFIGYQAGYEGSSANGNIGIGYRALYGTNNLTTGAHNTAVGYSAGWEIEQGEGNTYMGYKAGYENRHSDYTVFIGYEADEQTNGLSDYAVAIGYKAKAGASNVSIGREAGGIAGFGSNGYVTLVGYRAGYKIIGDQSTFVGAAAGRGAIATLTGDYNVGVGYKALYEGTSGQKNTAVGTESLEKISTGSSNVAVGYFAGDSVTTGDGGIFIGDNSDAVTASLTSPIAIGSGAKAGTKSISIGMDAQTSASSSNPPANTITIGESSGYSLNGADDCTFIGQQAGNLSNASGSNNTCIGHDSDPSSTTASNEITLGDSNIATLRCQVTSITALSDERDKTAIEDLDLGLKFVNAMKPRKFTWNRRDGKWVGKKELGFIAQELHELEMDFSSTERTRLVSYENPSRLEAQPMNTYPILVKAIQELSAKVDSLQAEITKLKGE